MFRRISSWFSRNGLGITLLGLIFALVFAWLTPTIFIFIPPGQAGVYWVRFGGGTIVDKVLPEGIALKWPWDKIFIYNARLQLSDGTFNALTSDGLNVTIEMSIRYHLVREDIALLHKYVGPDYVRTLLLPEVNSWSRREFAKYTPEELYSLKRAEIEDQITIDIQNAMRFAYRPTVDRESFVNVENVLIKNIRLPVKVEQAIQDKLVQFHIMRGYDFRVEREEKERQRKRVEALGIRDFQSIVSEGISEQYLKWKGISATLQLATSNNAKVVVIGAGEGGLPIILGNMDQPSVPSQTSARGAGDDANLPDIPEPASMDSFSLPEFSAYPAVSSETDSLAPADPLRAPQNDTTYETPLRFDW
jgi:regulator of protease activity HflC (stomatin/prohibitin superfamily)